MNHFCEVRTHLYLDVSTYDRLCNHKFLSNSHFVGSGSAVLLPLGPGRGSRGFVEQVQEAVRRISAAPVLLHRGRGGGGGGGRDLGGGCDLIGRGGRGQGGRLQQVGGAAVLWS